VQLRVAKGLGTRPYGTLRVSVITKAADAPPAHFDFDYSEPFAHRWKQFALHSSLVSVTGSSLNLTLGNTTTAIGLPPQGAGVAGVLIADPCTRIGSLTSLGGCRYAEKFKTKDRTPALLNAFVGDAATSFWGILGDNWYDRTGDLTEKIYDKLSLSTLAKPFVTVPGNHDYWILEPALAERKKDQFANGFMQYYAMDTLAARRASPGASGDAARPFNTSIDPSDNGSLPDLDNSLWYQQFGNLGMIGFSCAYDLQPIVARLSEACAWLPTQPGLEVAVLMGHWDTKNMGASADTMTPGIYEHARTLPGCKELDAKRRLKFVMGHTHCNIPHPHGYNDTGFMVAGQGMEGCGNYGVPVIDSTGGRLRMWYFKVVTTLGFDPQLAFATAERAAQTAPLSAPVEDTYDDLMACLQAHGSWRNCTSFAELWLDQPIA
jgi:hypothetical protein